MLPATLDARQWVAFAGLDPVRFMSGTTVDKKPRISRGGRLVAHGKARVQAVVMRKLLHAFFAMFRSDHSYDGSKLCLVEVASNPAAMCAA